MSEPAAIPTWCNSYGDAPPHSSIPVSRTSPVTSTSGSSSFTQEASHHGHAQPHMHRRSNSGSALPVMTSGDLLSAPLDGAPLVQRPYGPRPAWHHMMSPGHSNHLDVMRDNKQGRMSLELAPSPFACTQGVPDQLPAAVLVRPNMMQPIRTQQVRSMGPGHSPTGPNHWGWSSMPPMGPPEHMASAAQPIPPHHMTPAAKPTPSHHMTPHTQAIPPHSPFQDRVLVAPNPDGSSLSPVGLSAMVAARPPPLQFSGSLDLHPSRTLSTALTSSPSGWHRFGPDSTRQRRQAIGSEAVRENIRRMAVVSPHMEPRDSREPPMSDSEDEEFIESDWPRDPDLAQWPKPPEVTQAVCEALRKNFIFRDLPNSTLIEVVDRMYGVSFKEGSVVLQQGAMPKPDDCMFLLAKGEADLLIFGGGTVAGGSEQESTQGRNAVRIPQRPGWVFGDIALLFNTRRSASVVARSKITLWCLDRKTFLDFVLRHAQGARTLRFVRKLPLLQGMPDVNLTRLANRMKEQVYEDGQHLIRYGERGDELYIIRVGKVRVLRPDGKGGRNEVTVLGRGQVVGERALINGKLRSADCVAQGQVQVVSLNKIDFLDLDDPLLAWMVDYSVIATVLQALPHLKMLKQEQLEDIIDGFDAREELWRGQYILQEGDPIEKLYVIKTGEVQLLKGGRITANNGFVKEAGGFSFFGDCILDGVRTSPYSVVVHSNILHLLCLRRSLLAHLVVEPDRFSEHSTMALLKSHNFLQVLPDQVLEKIVETGKFQSYKSLEVIAASHLRSRKPCACMFLIQSGEVLVLAPNAPIPDSGSVSMAALVGNIKQRMKGGDIYNKGALLLDHYELKHCLVAGDDATAVVFNADDVAQVLGGVRVSSIVQLQLLAHRAAVPSSLPHQIDFKGLEMQRIIGTGQFGVVRLVRDVKSDKPYALKIVKKRDLINSSQQLEHVDNERRILEETSNCSFCVGLVGAFQDDSHLYLLQEFIPGGELFHHLDRMKRFDEHTARFYAANVVLALEHLHARGIVYRDLKPENLLLDHQGYCRMVDFGYAKQINTQKTYTICGTPDYQAPEVIERKGTSYPADLWALGVLIFEMLAGYPPFQSHSGDPLETFRIIVSLRYVVPPEIGNLPCDLITRVLRKAPESRLGAGPAGMQEIKQHPWFATLDWNALKQRKLPPPIPVQLQNPLDASNFDTYPERAPAEPLPAELQRWDANMWQWVQ